MFALAASIACARDSTVPGCLCSLSAGHSWPNKNWLLNPHVYHLKPLTVPLLWILGLCCMLDCWCVAGVTPTWIFHLSWNSPRHLTTYIRYRGWCWHFLCAFLCQYWLWRIFRPCIRQKEQFKRSFFYPNLVHRLEQQFRPAHANTRNLL